MKLKDVRCIGDWISDPAKEMFFEICIQDLIIIEAHPSEFFPNAGIDARNRIMEHFKISNNKINETLLMHYAKNDEWEEWDDEMPGV